MFTCAWLKEQDKCFMWWIHSITFPITNRELRRIHYPSLQHQGTEWLYYAHLSCLLSFWSFIQLTSTWLTSTSSPSQHCLPNLLQKNKNKIIFRKSNTIFLGIHVILRHFNSLTYKAHVSLYCKWTAPYLKPMNWKVKFVCNCQILLCSSYNGCIKKLCL